jgi:hypothetical protein
MVALNFNPEEDPAHSGDPDNVGGLEARALSQTAVVALALRVRVRAQSRLSKELVLKTAIHHSPRSTNNRNPSRLLLVARPSLKRTRPFLESRMEHVSRTRIVREGGFEVVLEEAHRDIISG